MQSVAMHVASGVVLPPPESRILTGDVKTPEKRNLINSYFSIFYSGGHYPPRAREETSRAMSLRVTVSITVRVLEKVRVKMTIDCTFYC